MHAGFLFDRTIRLTGYYSIKKYPDSLRYVQYEDFSNGNHYEYLTNDFNVEALTVAVFYRERWLVELFFKWIKRHLHIKSFFGTTENAVYTQIWIAVCDYLLLAIAKKIYHIDKNLYIISAAIKSVHFQKIDLSELFDKVKTPDVHLPMMVCYGYGRFSSDSSVAIWNLKEKL